MLILAVFMGFGGVFTGCSRLGGGTAAGVPRAGQLAARAVKSMGGPGSFKRVHYLHFEWVMRQGGRVVERREHLWDQKTGRYRLEGKTADGQPYVTLLNLKAQTGQGFGGYRFKPVMDPAKATQEAFGHFQDDTAWLLGVFQLQEPGAHLDYVGQLPLGQKVWPAITAWFDPSVGPKARTRTWYYLDEATGKPQGWSFAPKEGNPPPSTYVWTNWQAVGKLLLPVRFEQWGGDRVVTIENLYTPEEVGDNVFASVSAPVYTQEKMKF